MATGRGLLGFLRRLYLDAGHLIVSECSRIFAVHLVLLSDVLDELWVYYLLLVLLKVGNYLTVHVIYGRILCVDRASIVTLL